MQYLSENTVKHSELFTVTQQITIQITHEIQSGATIFYLQNFLYQVSILHLLRRKNTNYTSEISIVLLLNWV